jgi:membrane-bound lytic murein transglycosylase D
MSAPAMRGALVLLASLLLTACQTPKRPTAVEPPPPAPTPSAVETASAPEPPTPSIAPTAPPDLYARLRARLQHQDCDSDAAQRRWVQLYAPRPERFGQRIAPMLPLLEYVLTRIEAEDLPGEFALIPIIESSYQPQARSRSGPAGLWQFTADTARGFGLRVDSGLDERFAPVEATAAALEFLSDLQQTHGDWVLAAAGFNAGAYRISRLLRSAPQPAAGELPRGLARGTYEYVEKLKAWACMLGQPERFGIALPDPQALTRLEPVRTPIQAQQLSLLSEVSGLRSETLLQLNPLLRASTRSRSERELLLPEDAAEEVLEFVQRLQRGEIELPAPARTYTVRAGDTLSAIASRHGLRATELAELNRIKLSGVLRIGQVLRLEP